MAQGNGSRSFNVAVVGATGIVGQEFLRILVQRRFPVRSLKLIASERSAGKRLWVGESELTVEALTPSSLAGADFVFISATDEISREYCPIAAKAGAIAIDDSGVWRMDPDVPLVVPEVNADDVERHKGILAIPNCSTTPVVMTLWPIHRRSRVRRVIAATYQSVSGTGKAAVAELEEQVQRLDRGEAVVPHVYPHQIAYNVLPHIGSFKEDGYTSEEWKMRMETQKIMHDPEIAFSATCVRVPVFIGHSAAVHVELSDPLDAEEVRRLLAQAPGVVVQDEPAINLYPHPVEAAGHDPVYVGRIRNDTALENGIAFWVTADNLRKGAALNAIQIAEELIARNLVPS
ncbi:MAG TPA: aspartate-semialdehyde dehydrogenase, partial [Dehalococcoidia bacterium]|nr:aspartate-semialdehyde dehydrogenase [Dehalococcoidia bacterium]